MVLVNFALEKLGSQIKSDKVSVDGYEAEKLLLGDAGWQKNGFLAERFIKPPVTLTVHLPCPVNIFRVILDPQVGGQRSSAIEIYTAVAHRTVTMAKTGRSSSAVNGRSVNGNTQNGISSAKIDTEFSAGVSEPEPLFVRVASVHCAGPGQVCCFNPRFRSETLSSTNNFPSIESYQHCAEIRHHQWWAVSAVEYVAVRITSAIGGGVVALGHLEVWGQPAHSCPLRVKEDIINKYITVVKPLTETQNVHTNAAACIGPNKSSIPSESGIDKHQNTTADLMSSGPNDSVPIPEEFLDLLTCDIMVTPMLLPSGHTVDVSTIDRFSEVEAMHGRQASDPFTGLAFTASRRPMLNRGLKERIDRFLSENAHDPILSKVPRLLGYQDSQIMSSTDDFVNTKAGIANRRMPGNLNTPSSVKRRHTSSTHGAELLPTKLTKKSVCSATGQSDKSVTLCSSGDTKDPFSTEARMQTHEDHLKNSLSSSLSLVLQGLPSFTAPFPSQLEKPKQCCGACGKDLKDLGILVYKLLCTHLICRVCLTAVGRKEHIICPLCSAYCKRSDIVRKHV